MKFMERSSFRSAWGILIDLTRCTGCNSCALACKESNDLALPYPGAVPDGLDSDTYTFVQEHWVTTDAGDVKQRFVKRQCMHCLNASCVSACPAAYAVIAAQSSTSNAVTNSFFLIFILLSGPPVLPHSRGCSLHARDSPDFCFYE